MGIYKNRTDKKEYITVDELRHATGINEVTIRTYLCHYSLIPYMSNCKRAYKLQRNKNAIETFISYLIKRKRLTVASKRNLYNLIKER